ncbi:unnamed protein product [Phyllotreta striolata]|uniref:Lipase domain-containing protein n=1 Tax=Phyllotreta striolata TaxID=444603 RepID=A0A9N9XTS7_PHYSR|nr:unnamed protein product [Phyllotreta striolata]
MVGNEVQEINRNRVRGVLSLGNCRIVYNPVCPDPDVTFFLFTKHQPKYPVPIRVGTNWKETNFNQTRFDPRKPTKIIIHGYNSDMNISALVEVRNEYLKTKDYNIFVVDWSPLNQSPCYLGALLNLPHVGACCAQLIQRLLDVQNFDIHVIGFSLGAQITNHISVALRPYRLPRITGLDPALPGFVTLHLDGKLDKSDAQFVDVYHTNAFFQGKVEESGHVDFYINGGIVQPGCWAQTRFFACNHHRAPLYFAETINTEKHFYAWPCPTYFDYLLGRCPPGEPQIIMGEYVRRAAQGVYLVITESVSPFAVGKYEGPSVEIFKSTEQYRRKVLDMYRKRMVGFVDEYDLFEQLVDDRMDVKSYDELVEVVLSSENVDLLSVL